VLEDVDFIRVGEPGALEEVVANRLERHALAGVDRETLLDGLRVALSTPLGPLFGDTALRVIARSDRLDELSFDLPLAGGYGAGSGALRPETLAEVFEAHAGGSTAPLAEYAERLRSDGLSFEARGFLTGSIDLVARIHRDGASRYLVADHKSNWLGDRLADGDVSLAGHYHPSRLAGEMVGHHYMLQYHLYLVALHRLLRSRLGAAYDYDRDVAGVAYLFLRGMTGPEVLRDESGHPYGVYADRPPRALVDDLDAALRDPGGAGG
jgi:exodeoxyribonuclease V beta subunit